MPIKYPTEFKVKAIRRYEKGESIKELCKELNISQSIRPPQSTHLWLLSTTCLPFSAGRIAVPII